MAQLMDEARDAVTTAEPDARLHHVVRDSVHEVSVCQYFTLVMGNPHYRIDDELHTVSVIGPPVPRAPTHPFKGDRP